MELQVLDRAVSKIISSNEVFATETAVVRGVEYPVFKNAPLTLCDLLKRGFALHNNGNAEYLIYQSER